MYTEIVKIIEGGLVNDKETDGKIVRAGTQNSPIPVSPLRRSFSPARRVPGSSSLWAGKVLVHHGLWEQVYGHLVRLHREGDCALGDYFLSPLPYRSWLTREV